MNEPNRKILVAFDDSPASHKAFDLALEFSRSREGSGIVVLSVVQVPDLIDVSMDLEPIINASRTKLEAAQEALKAKAAAFGVEIVTDCVVGHAAETVVDYAEQSGVDMIVLGNRGRTRIAEWLLGSVSHQVAAEARCTVTIVK
jgi:nucleotide-binding universal stress UspA family protein